MLPGAPVNTAIPKISGPAARGSSLRTNPGSWNPAAASYRYQWQRSTSHTTSWANIRGATTRTYTPVRADQNARLRVRVVAKNAYGQATAVMAPTAAVKSSPRHRSLD